MAAQRAIPMRPVIERQPALPTEVTRLRWSEGRWARLREEPVPFVPPTPAAQADSPVPGHDVPAAQTAEAGRPRVPGRLTALAAIFALGRRTAEGVSRS